MTGIAAVPGKHIPEQVWPFLHTHDTCMYNLLYSWVDQPMPEMALVVTEHFVRHMASDTGILHIHNAQ